MEGKKKLIVWMQQHVSEYQSYKELAIAAVAANGQCEWPLGDIESFAYKVICEIKK